MARPLSPATRRYVWRIWPTMVVYSIVLVASETLLESETITGPLKYFVAVAPALPLVATIYFVGELLYQKEDEFLRHLWIEGSMWGAAITLAATTVWGFLEIAGAPRIPLYWVFPFFTFVAIVAAYLLRRKYE
jgi:hypothetical protein